MIRNILIGLGILLYVLVLSNNAVAQSRYAILIGIGDYPEETGWHQIHGDNDVVIIKDFLVGQGVEEENISILVNADATRANIMANLESLKDKAGRGDIIYIHFLFFFQQVTDLDGDEDDHFDEAWIPFDARKKFEAGIYEGENHIIDDELNDYLNGLRVKVGQSGKIIVVSDACHSGSGTRGLSDNDNEYVRGTRDQFIIPLAPANVIKKKDPVSWLFIGACKPFQSNYEYKTESGIYYGSLSYVISRKELSINAKDYKDVLNEWREALLLLTRFPQDLDDEGRPSKKSDLLF